MLDLLMKRRSIRKFRDVKLDRDQIDQLMKAALLAPSSKGRQPWEFIVVTEPDMLDKLADSRETGASFLKDAPLAIVIVADPRKSDVWIEDTAIAATLIQLEAETMDLGSCWIQVRNRMRDATRTTESDIRELLEIPEELHVASMIAVGVPDEQKAPYTEEDLQRDKVYADRYGDGLSL